MWCACACACTVYVCGTCTDVQAHTPLSSPVHAEARGGYQVAIPLQLLLREDLNEPGAKLTANIHRELPVSAHNSAGLGLLGSKLSIARTLSQFTERILNSKTQSIHSIRHFLSLITANT